MFENRANLLSAFPELQQKTLCCSLLKPGSAADVGWSDLQSFFQVPSALNHLYISLSQPSRRVPASWAESYHIHFWWDEFETTQRKTLAFA